MNVETLRVTPNPVNAELCDGEAGVLPVLTCLTLGVTVRRLVERAGVVLGVSIEDMTQGGAAGTGRQLSVHAIRG